MIAAICEIEHSKRLKTKLSSSWHRVRGRMVLINYTSRAGFYSNKILHSRIKGCRKGRANKWLHFHADGEMVLCCMDWQKETVFGDIKQQSLGEILNSKSYRKLLLQVKGEFNSKRDFICKRCEWAWEIIEPRLAHSDTVDSERDLNLINSVNFDG